MGSHGTIPIIRRWCMDVVYRPTIESNCVICGHQYFIELHSRHSARSDKVRVYSQESEEGTNLFRCITCRNPITTCLPFAGHRPHVSSPPQKRPKHKHLKPRTQNWLSIMLKASAASVLAIALLPPLSALAVSILYLCGEVIRVNQPNHTSPPNFELRAGQ
jgi:hypothetical protein